MFWRPMLTTVKDKYGSNEEVIAYIDDIMKDILDNLAKFLTPANKDQLPFFIEAPDPMANYKVNLIVDNSELQGACGNRDQPILLQTIRGDRKGGQVRGAGH